MSAMLEFIGLMTVIGGAVLWIASTVRHRRHLSQCVQDLQRFRRLDRRLTACVVEMEHILDEIPPQPDERVVPEDLVGHVQFLYGLRQEARDNAANLGRHSVRLLWGEGLLSKATPTAKRCEVAHGALIGAFQSLADATREYERGLSGALLQSGNGGSARPLTDPVRLLDESAATEVARLRDVCEKSLTTAADACKLRFGSVAIFDTKWPVRRSEVSHGSDVHHPSEPRPMSWKGFGPQPLLHVDAK